MLAGCGGRVPGGPPCAVGALNARCVRQVGRRIPVGEGQEGEDWPGCVVLLTACPGSETWQALPVGRPRALWGARVEFPLTLECVGASLLVMAVSQSLLQEW